MRRLRLEEISFKTRHPEDEAKDEMINGGSGFHPVWQDLLRYIDALDVDSMRAAVEAQGHWQ